MSFIDDLYKANEAEKRKEEQLKAALVYEKQYVDEVINCVKNEIKVQVKYNKRSIKGFFYYDREGDGIYPCKSLFEAKKAVKYRAIKKLYEYDKAFLKKELEKHFNNMGLKRYKVKFYNKDKKSALYLELEW